MSGGYSNGAASNRRNLRDSPALFGSPTYKRAAAATNNAALANRFTATESPTKKTCTDFCNKIGHKRTFRLSNAMSALPLKTDIRWYAGNVR
jgi:hypothetical protein